MTFACLTPLTAALPIALTAHDRVRARTSAAAFLRFGLLLCESRSTASWSELKTFVPLALFGPTDVASHQPTVCPIVRAVTASLRRD